MPVMAEERYEVKESNRRGRDDAVKRREHRRRSDSESSDEERVAKRGARREREREGERERDIERMGRWGEKEDDIKTGIGKHSDSDSSDADRVRKRGEKRERASERPDRRDREQHRSKRVEDEEEDKEVVIDRRDRRMKGDGDTRQRERRDRERKSERRENTSDSSDGDTRQRERRDKERKSERRENTREKEDDIKTSIGKESGSDSSDADRVRKRGEKRERASERRDRRDREQHRSKRLEDKEEDKEVLIDRRDRRMKDDRSRRNERRQGSDSSDGDTRQRERRDRERKSERTENTREDKREEVKKNGDKDVKVEPKKPVDPNENPGGPLATLGRTGGVYIPPFKLARMMKEIEDKASAEYQRLTWDALRKSINGLVNKVNATNIKNIIPELFGENLIRGRGLFCRSCMKSQMASPGFTDVFAALVAVVNTKFPEIGDLLLRRIVLQLKRSFKRNDKPQLLAAVKFIAHLVNQQVAHEIVALELVTILLANPTDDSVEVAVDFIKECGCILQDLCPKGLHGIFERFRGILHEGEIDKRVQFLIEGLFAIRKAKFQGHPAVRPELDLVEPEDQLTHEISLEDDVIDPETSIDIFKQDPNFVENERKYEDVKKSILGDESEDEEDADSGSDEDDDDDDEDEEDDEEQMQIKDATETNLVNLRRTIYLTIMSSVDFEEAGHKLLKIKLEPGQEMELCIMLLECCSQERTYLRYYGLLGQRFCMINKVHQENFEKCFVQQYSMIHRLETNKLRNVAKFFAHLLGTDALPWHVLSYIRLTEEDTTSSSRIFIKILFQELSEHLGIRLLNERLNDPSMNDTFESIFPKDNPRNTRFAINFFTSIGLGGLTENLREYLKNMPRMIMQQQKPESEDESDSGSSSSSSDSSSSESESDSSPDESDSDEDKRRKRRKRK